MVWAKAFGDQRLGEAAGLRTQGFDALGFDIGGEFMLPQFEIRDPKEWFTPGINVRFDPGHTTGGQEPSDFKLHFFQRLGDGFGFDQPADVLRENGFGLTTEYKVFV